MENARRSFAEALRFYRHEAGLTQKALARMCGISRTYVVMLEKAEAPPPSDEVIANLEKSLDLDQHCLRSMAHFERSPQDIQKNIQLLSEEILTTRRQNQKLLAALLVAMVGACSSNDELKEKLNEIARGNENMRRLLDLSSLRKTSAGAIIQAVSDFIHENPPDEIKKIPEQIERISKQGYS